jgi:hypothetical protein
MTIKNAAADFMAAISLMNRAQDACRNLRPLSCALTPGELQGRAEIVARVIRARAKLQLLRDRSRALENAVMRFKEQQETIRARAERQDRRHVVRLAVEPTTLLTQAQRARLVAWSQLRYAA